MLLVALRKESVDRNVHQSRLHYSDLSGSLSARRAWIEICPTCQWRRSVKVALRKESVDRNVDPDADTLTDDVALRKESVDRNVVSHPL